METFLLQDEPEDENVGFHELSQNLSFETMNDHNSEEGENDDFTLLGIERTVSQHPN